MCVCACVRACVWRCYGEWFRDAKEGTNEMFYFTTHTQHILFMVIWRWTYGHKIVREETRCRHMGYSFQLTARVLLYAPSHRQDSTYHSLLHQSGALAGTRNSSMGFRDACVLERDHWGGVSMML